MKIGFKIDKNKQYSLPWNTEGVFADSQSEGSLEDETGSEQTTTTNELFWWMLEILTFQPNSSSFPWTQHARVDSLQEQHSATANLIV